MHPEPTKKLTHVRPFSVHLRRRIGDVLLSRQVVCQWHAFDVQIQAGVKSERQPIEIMCK